MGARFHPAVACKSFSFLDKFPFWPHGVCFFVLYFVLLFDSANMFPFLVCLCMSLSALPLRASSPTRHLSFILPRFFPVEKSLKFPLQNKGQKTKAVLSLCEVESSPFFPYIRRKPKLNTFVSPHLCLCLCLHVVCLLCVSLQCGFKIGGLVFRGRSSVFASHRQWCSYNGIGAIEHRGSWQLNGFVVMLSYSVNLKQKSVNGKGVCSRGVLSLWFSLWSVCSNMKN